MEQKYERRHDAASEAEVDDGESVNGGFVHRMMLDESTTVEVHTSSAAEFAEMLAGRMSGEEEERGLRDDRESRTEDGELRTRERQLRTGDTMSEDREVMREDNELRTDDSELRTVDTMLETKEREAMREDELRTADSVTDVKTDDNIGDLRTHEGWHKYSKKLRAAGRMVRERQMKGWPHFERVFMVSSLDGDGVWDIKNYFLDTAPRGKWLYHQSLIANQDPRLVARQCVQEKLLDHLPNEIPYQIQVRLALWEEDEHEMLRAAFDLICERKRHLYYALGKGGATARTIAIEAKQELMKTFRRELSLRLVVRLKQT